MSPRLTPFPALNHLDSSAQMESNACTLEPAPFSWYVASFGCLALALALTSTTPRPRRPCGLRRPFQRLLPAGLGGSFGDEITDPFNQFSRALVGQNAALDRSLSQRP